VSETPRDALLLAVNHSGDTDSTGALTGQLLGAAGGSACFRRSGSSVARWSRRWRRSSPPCSSTVRRRIRSATRPG